MLSPHWTELRTFGVKYLFLSYLSRKRESSKALGWFGQMFRRSMANSISLLWTPSVKSSHHRSPEHKLFYSISSNFNSDLVRNKNHFFSPGTLEFLCTSSKWILNILQEEQNVKRIYLDPLLKNQASPFLPSHTHLSWIFIAVLKALKKSQHSDFLLFSTCW